MALHGHEMDVLLDAERLWDALPRAQKQRFGVAAIVHLAGELGAQEGLAPLQGWEAASTEGFAAMERLLRGALGVPLQRPDLRAIGVQACRACGCTDACACPDGCFWVERDLCSACAATGALRCEAGEIADAAD